jgi:hypothetical protein
VALGRNPAKAWTVTLRPSSCLLKLTAPPSECLGYVPLAPVHVGVENFPVHALASDLPQAGKFPDDVDQLVRRDTRSAWSWWPSWLSLWGSWSSWTWSQPDKSKLAGSSPSSLAWRSHAAR